MLFTLGGAGGGVGGRPAAGSRCEESSALQVVLLQMQRGDQVYVELTSGRKLCNGLQNNIFTGHIVYPD